jgi:hypothetical protein
MTDPQNQAEYADALATRRRKDDCWRALQAARARQARLLQTYDELMAPSGEPVSRTSVFRPKPDGLIDPDSWSEW